MNSFYQAQILNGEKSLHLAKCSLSVNTTKTQTEISICNSFHHFTHRVQLLTKIPIKTFHTEMTSSINLMTDNTNVSYLQFPAHDKCSAEPGAG